MSYYVVHVHYYCVYLLITIVPTKYAHIRMCWHCTFGDPETKKQPTTQSKGHALSCYWAPWTFLTVDPDGPLEVTVPHFPVPNEVVEFQEGDQTELIHVREVTGSSMRGHQLCEVQSSQHWVPGDDTNTCIQLCMLHMLNTPWIVLTSGSEQLRHKRFYKLAFLKHTISTKYSPIISTRSHYGQCTNNLTTFHLTERKQTHVWEVHGLRLHIPEGALPSDHTRHRVDVRAGLSGQFEFPEGSRLVGAGYWLSCEEKFTPAMLEVLVWRIPMQKNNKKNSHREPVIDQWTQQPLMVKHHFELLWAYPWTQLS